MTWLKKLSSPQISLDLGDYQAQLRYYLTDLSERSVNSQYPYTEEDVEQDYQRILSQTQANMQNILALVQNAMSGLKWNGSPVVVKAAQPFPESRFRGPDYSNPIADAHISVNGAEFTLFNLEDGKIEIDDILEADEEDFFPTPQIRTDYFQLIRRLKNPSAIGENKVLTLYTARPIQDRALYEGANQVPANIYLTNTYGRAEGIALDLSGTQSKMRDIWKVRIEEKYLMQTLDAMGQKDYQVIGEGMVPVRNITLLSPGE
jgi:hypothetical protein